MREVFPALPVIAIIFASEASLFLEAKLSKNFSIYGLLGFGNLYGLGFAWQQNYNENGLMVGWSRGIALNENAFGSFSVSYQ